MKMNMNFILECIERSYFLPHYILFKHSSQKNVIQRDIEVYLGGQQSKHTDKLSFFQIIKNPYFRKVFYMRLGSYSRFISWYTKEDSSFRISKHCEIAGGFRAIHSYATIINAKKIGECFSVRQCTTIGNKVDGRNDLVPIIGNNVSVGANVVVIGDITIGNNVTIGAGAVVTKDVPNNAVVAGNPAHILYLKD